MPTKPKTKPKKVKVTFPTPRKHPLPVGLKGARVEEIWAEGKALWKDDPDIDQFLEQVRTARRD